MAKYYVCDTGTNSGIARYSERFFKMGLEPEGYVHLHPDEVTDAFLGAQSGNSIWHVELGALQHRERIAFTKLIHAGFQNIDVTLHDPPFLTFPWYHFNNLFIDRLSRGVDWYLGTFGLQTKYLKRVRRVFVLSEKGATEIRKRHAISNVQTIPLCIDPASVWSRPLGCSERDIIFFGFIGPSKGLDWALDLHCAIRAKVPDVTMHVIGQAAGPRGTKFLDGLKQRYQDGVLYHGYLQEGELDNVFKKSAHVFLPFKPYPYYCPTSASVLDSLRRGRIVWTTDVNSVGETISPNVNGMFFSGDTQRDLDKFLSLQMDSKARRAISEAALETASGIALHDYRQYFDEIS